MKLNNVPNNIINNIITTGTLFVIYSVIIIKEKRQPMGMYINPGNSLFKRALNSKIYVDKSKLISYVNDVIDTEQEFICVSRPRRFGKSMAANMLAAYYSCGCNSKELFDKLEIKKCNTYENNINSYDTIFLNIPKFLVKAPDIKALGNYIENILIKEFKDQFQDYDITELTDLNTIISHIANHYKYKNKGFIFIIDEWDCVFREAIENTNAQKNYLNFLRNIFKDNGDIKLVYMTGILPIKKYGSHSAINIFDEFSMTDPAMLAEYVGFTEDEVINLCIKYNMDFNEMQYWYNGYMFDEKLHIYNPESVVTAITRKKYKSYWTRTETYEALKVYIDMNFDGLKDNIIKMLAGSRIKISIDTFQNDMTTFASKDDVLTLLVHLGYLAYDYNLNEVFIPNHEIQEEFTTATKISNWNEIVKSITLSDKLLEATIAFENETVSHIIDEIHMATASVLQYNNENSLACVISLAYYSARKDYIMHREFPTGKGFADLVFIPRRNTENPVIIVELKWNHSAEGAIKQIKDKNYTETLKDYSGQIILAGINYNKKTKKHECIIENDNK